MDADYSHIVWKCDQITQFLKMLYDTLLKILGYKIPTSCTVLYQCDLCDENIQSKDRYLVKILLTAGGKKMLL